MESERRIQAELAGRRPATERNACIERTGSIRPSGGQGLEACSLKQFAQKLPRVQPQRLGVLDELQNAERPLALLHIRNVAVASIDALGKLLLSETGLLSGLFQNRA